LTQVERSKRAGALCRSQRWRSRAGAAERGRCAGPATSTELTCPGSCPSRACESTAARGRGACSATAREAAAATGGAARAERGRCAGPVTSTELTCPGSCASRACEPTAARRRGARTATATAVGGATSGAARERGACTAAATAGAAATAFATRSGGGPARDHAQQAGLAPRVCQPAYSPRPNKLVDKADAQQHEIQDAGVWEQFQPLPSVEELLNKPFPWPTGDDLVSAKFPTTRAAAEHCVHAHMRQFEVTDVQHRSLCAVPWCVDPVGKQVHRCLHKAAMMFGLGLVAPQGGALREHASAAR
jgi:hypothetical protein